MSVRGGSIGRREVAVRCFAAEYEDASLEYSESDEERAPNYVVTPTGARVNRLFVVGVLTEVESVSDDVLRGRVVDPTGAFVVYAGQYQPDAKTALERAEPPVFVAVTGKARTFEPNDSDRIYTSIRPESINVVDADTRDRWTIQSAEQTVARVATFAAAIEREERGAALTDVLLESGVDPALASGIPRAIDHYGTTESYLAAVRELAVQSAAVVAGEREEVDPLELGPADGGTVDVDLSEGFTMEATTPAERLEADESTTTATETASQMSSETASEPPSPETELEGVEPEPQPVETESETSEVEQGAVADVSEREATGPEDSGSSDDELGDFDDFGGGSEEFEGNGEDGGEATAGVDATEPTADQPGSDELYEMDEEERASVEAEFGTEFTTGSEVDGPGEAEIETPGPETGSESGDAETSGGETTEAASGVTETTSEEEPGQTDTADVAADDEESSVEDAEEPDDVDLVDAVVSTMEELDDGDGADREAVIETVVADHGVEESAVEEAIQDALMGGRCYEPDDGYIKAI